MWREVTSRELCIVHYKEGTGINNLTLPFMKLKKQGKLNSETTKNRSKTMNGYKIALVENNVNKSCYLKNKQKWLASARMTVKIR